MENFFSKLCLSHILWFAGLLGDGWTDSHIWQHFVNPLVLACPLFWVLMNLWWVTLDPGWWMALVFFSPLWRWNVEFETWGMWPHSFYLGRLGLGFALNRWLLDTLLSFTDSRKVCALSLLPTRKAFPVPRPLCSQFRGHSVKVERQWL